MNTRGQQGNRAGQKDEFGNPIQHTTDAYGNPLASQEGTGLHGTTGVGGGGQPQMTREQHTTTVGYGTTGVGGGGQPQMTHPKEEQRTTTGGYGTTGVGSGGKPQMTHPEKEQRGGGILHRSGSSSSSSSEDDGMGGRRKKGLKDKIKEKLPGGRKTDEQGQGQGYGQGQTTTGPGTGYGGNTTATTGTTGQLDPEKKGFVEKIKEKLPGRQ